MSDSFGEQPYDGLTAGELRCDSLQTKTQVVQTCFSTRGGRRHVDDVVPNKFNELRHHAEVSACTKSVRDQGDDMSWRMGNPMQRCKLGWVWKQWLDLSKIFQFWANEVVGGCATMSISGACLSVRVTLYYCLAG